MPKPKKSNIDLYKDSLGLAEKVRRNLSMAEQRPVEESPPTVADAALSTHVITSPSGRRVDVNNYPDRFKPVSTESPSQPRPRSRYEYELATLRPFFKDTGKDLYYQTLENVRANQREARVGQPVFETEEEKGARLLPRKLGNRAVHEAPQNFAAQPMSPEEKARLDAAIDLSKFWRR